MTTTLDADLQRLAVRAISNAGIGEAQAALVAMRPDGRVVAMVGGKSYKESPFNRATQARRQPGSAFKLFVYLAALRAGYSPDDMIEDRPITIDGWTPRNSDGVYRGTITLREAFARSSNAAAVRLSERVGRDNVIRAARELGIRSPLSDNPSLALGSSSVSLIELTAAYAAIAGGRYPVQPRGLPLARERDARDGVRGSPAGGSLDRRRDWAPMLDLLWAAANEGTGRRAALAVPTFGKTGTTQDHQRRDLRRLCRRPGGRGVGRARRQSIARQCQRRDRAGVDLARLHRPGDGDRPAPDDRACPIARRSARLPEPRAEPDPARMERRGPRDRGNDRGGARADRGTWRNKRRRAAIAKSMVNARQPVALTASQLSPAYSACNRGLDASGEGKWSPEVEPNFRRPDMVKFLKLIKNTTRVPPRLNTA